MKSPSFFDTHCHIDFPHYSDDRDAVLTRMAEQGVDYCVAVGVDFEHLDRLRSLAESRENVWFSVGLHPNHKVSSEPTTEALCEMADHPKCVAIGETGLDFFRHHVEPEVQEQRFRTHIRAAQKLGMPVIVHNREADADSIRVLREENIGECGGIMHCFSTDLETASAALDMGMHISFSGNVTFKNNQSLRDVAAQVPLDRILIETDAPFLAPVPYRGKRNEPTYVKQVAECIAEVKGLSLDELAAATTANGLELFGIQP